MIKYLKWFSSDPICIQLQTTEIDKDNNATCHVCVIVTKVSYELGNILHDRALLVGTMGNCEKGFFDN